MGLCEDPVGDALVLGHPSGAPADPSLRRTEMFLKFLFGVFVTSQVLHEWGVGPSQNPQPGGPGYAFRCLCSSIHGSADTGTMEGPVEPYQNLIKSK